MNGMTPEERLKALAFIRARLPLAEVYLFGPRSRDNCEPCMDARLAIDNNGYRLDALIIQQLHQEINNMPGSYSFDIYDLNSMTEADQKEIRAHGVRLHE